MYRYRRQFNRPGPPEKDSETVLGINGNGNPVSIDREDLSGHFLICGKTGTGKTNLLRLLLGSLDASDSNVILFDPHGQLSEWSIRLQDCLSTFTGKDMELSAEKRCREEENICRD